MFSHVDLTHRQQYILKATVQHYIATAEPVGSKALVDDLSVSSATIRSVMGVLEKAGLLYQPHTSAGRIPSDFGYRLYVDELIAPSHTQAEQAAQLLGKKLNWESWSIEALLREAAKLLSSLSGYITLITLPQTSHSRLRHLQIVRVDRWRVMLILITDAYETQSTLMELPAAIDEDGNDTADEAADEAIDRELQILSNFLNAELRGRLLTELSQLDWTELDREFQRYADALTKRLGDLSRQFQTPTATHMTIGGVAQMLRQPEFAELHQVQPLLQCLESEPDRILPLLSVPAKILTTNSPRVTVRIGAENSLEPMRTCTLVSANYHRDTIPVGSIGVLGPTRMLYENAIAIVAAAADYLSQTLSET